MISEFSAALNQVATERGIDKKDILQAIEMALVAAYKKDFAEKDASLEGVTAQVDELTGEARILKDGKDITPAGFGRIASQTAKQVILQQLRRTEEDSILDEYRKKIGEVLQGTVFRVDQKLVVLDLGRAQGVMPLKEQIPNENYTAGMRLRVLVKDIQDMGRGPEVLVSRADEEFIKALFKAEVPEMTSGTVKIVSIAREPGSRTKIAVESTDSSIDPVGACVGHKGVRVQSVLNELNGEKIDIVPYNPDPVKYIAAALSPARVTAVKTITEEKKAIVSVPEDQQSLAIGKQGQNVRLAHKLTGWKIDIEGVEDFIQAAKKAEVELTEEEEKRVESRQKRGKSIAVLNLDKKIEKALRHAGVTTVEQLKEMTRKDLLKIEGIGSRSAEKVLKAVSVH
ncbi:MAG TPA: transcription termination/antitermination protein NusA [candidate division WWE3 bacterium]|uniref:Transcription termination/antitermination protein NusA n=1 Tax=candidate division WWE3 bacterium TaxID=2053526 RepID=A0A7V5J0F2_UNCKA|nr:transcription termination/antitermination protein NusA [candidate division WWE3 bacterium]